MKIKTSDLQGTALDWAVAKAEGFKEVIIHHGWVKIPIDFINERYPERGIGYKQYGPSRSWRLAGPIIERELISVDTNFLSAGYEHPNGKWEWRASCVTEDDKAYWYDGPTFLIAAMRCYVTSKLGTEVDIPEELIK